MNHRKHSTAAIDGISDCPGDPCDTSIPRIMVGALETTGMEGECSTARIEFNPPSCKIIKSTLSDVGQFTQKKKKDVGQMTITNPCMTKAKDSKLSTIKEELLE